jgi:hypothetical protein
VNHAFQSLPRFSANLRILSVGALAAMAAASALAQTCMTWVQSGNAVAVNPDLQVFSVANAHKLIWSAPNVVLEQADVPTGPWTVVPGATPPFDIALAGPGKFFRLQPTGP